MRGTATRGKDRNIEKGNAGARKKQECRCLGLAGKALPTTRFRRAFKVEEFART